MKKIILFFAVMLLVLPITAQADLYNFHLIGDDNEPSNDLGPQLQMDVTEGATSGIDFKFQNIGDIDSFIADIYFDTTPDDFLNFSSFSFSYEGIVAFSPDATPGDLSGGNTISFESDWDADANPSVGGNNFGINNFATGDIGSAESLTINFAYTTDQTFDSVISQINSGGLLVGLHVQGIYPEGESEAYVNNVAPVPEPATMLLFGTGLVGLAGARFRKKK